MDKEMAIKKPAHILVIPWPAQGHINPALAFAKCLASKGLRITIITTTNLSKSAKISVCSSIAVEVISDGSEEIKKPETIEGYFKRFKDVISQNLAEFIDKQKSSDCPAKLIMYDSTMPWVLDIAHERGLLGASFFTMSCAVSAIFYHLKQGVLRFPYEDSAVSFPSLPTLETEDLPYIPQFLMDEKHNVITLLADQFSNLEKVDWIFINTFDELEKEIVNWMVNRWPIKTIGPTFLLQQTDKEFSDNKNQMIISLFEPRQEACREWLDSKETGSVVYVSFGSIASLGNEQMEELAFGLIMSNCYFLWVVRSSEVDKLPQDFTSLASDKGLIIDWCHQQQVLAHHALGCFMSHCGWNSTLEALSHGVPLITMAQWVDQKTNAKFIEDVWGVGVGVKGIELKKNACKWIELKKKCYAIEKKLLCASKRLLKEIKGLSLRKMPASGRIWLMRLLKKVELLLIVLRILFQNSCVADL